MGTREGKNGDIRRKELDRGVLKGGNEGLK
jgi:hypothetical protein